MKITILKKKYQVQVQVHVLKEFPFVKIIQKRRVPVTSTLKHDNSFYDEKSINKRSEFLPYLETLSYFKLLQATNQKHPR
jgi:hypothetical protein